MTLLEQWLKQATCQLSKEAVAQVRSEINEHFELAFEAAIAKGAIAQEADRLAVAALGDAATANRQYRKVMLTSGEAKALREGNWEARVVCSHTGVKWMLLGIPVAVLIASAASFGGGKVELARVLLLGGLAMGLCFAAPFLPVYTPSRARVYRSLKWIALIGTLSILFAPFVLEWSWLLISCLWPAIWTEWTRFSIRRKLPVAKWPKQLYL